MKDSVFSDLFKKKKYLLQLYKALHPEDTAATEDELADITIRNEKAITETIRICKDRNVLREYLEDREKEVVSIMMSLYDEEEVM
ncbi:MAG: hypothetical protein NC416_05520, partial [Eubacterium sp.]|nr:hypothetical protein [Eubacterium sp.]